MVSTISESILSVLPQLGGGMTVPEIAQALEWKTPVFEITEALEQLQRDRLVESVPVEDAGCRYTTWRKVVRG